CCVLSISLSSLYTPTMSCFSFNDSVYHRDPPSYPTRRSSDLPLEHGSFAEQRIDPDAADDEQCVDGSAQGAERRVGDESETRRGDRKSTRLNSSHLGISYAVFCLKKKKTIL